MAFGFTSYVEPGAYQQEVIVPSGINIPAQPFAVCLVGTGSRNKRVTNESVLRGAVKGESLSPAGSSPHLATLANRADKRSENTVVYRTLNGITTVVLSSLISFERSYVLGTVSTAGTVDLSGSGATRKAIALEMDGKSSVTIIFESGAGAPVATVTGHDIEVVGALSGTAGDAATFTEIASFINAGLAAATSLGYGAAYSAVADASGSFLQITSPADTVSAPVQDVKVYDPIANSAVDDLFGTVGSDPTGANRNALSILRIDDLIWNASATWTADYARIDNDADSLVQTTGIQSLVAVGSSPGTSNFDEAFDYNLTSNQVDWSPDSAATITGNAETFDVSSNDIIVIDVDNQVSSITGLSDIEIDLDGLASPPLGYTDPVDPANATAAEIAANINAVLAQHIGPKYKAVATDSSGTLVLTSPIEGRASHLRVSAPTANSALVELFGAEIERMGGGRRPVAGSEYFVSYEHIRPDSDYDIPIRHFSVEEAKAQVGQVSPGVAAYNPLAVASEIAFDNGAEYIYTIQVNDLTEGNPTRAQIQSALEGAEVLAGTTEILVVGEPGTRLDITVDVKDHLEEQNGPTEKHYRRAFYGMLPNTAIGDRDTENTLIYRAARTLQVAPTSPARGRMFFIAPPQIQGVTRTLVFEDGTEARVSMDTTYMAVAVAARRTSLPGPAETLTRRTITGFNTDDIANPWRPKQRRAMASQGVLVVTYDAGQFKILDAVSTEAGGGNKDSFKVDSTSYQKDIIVTKVDQALDQNIVGIVPFDLASFVLDIKLIIQGVITGEISSGTIGPYRFKDTGAIRAINLRLDIRVAQSTQSLTQFNFAYWFNLRYPALRLLGQYSTDNPFFALAAAA